MAQFENFTEAEIIARVLNGEKALYEIIVRRFNPYLYKIGRSYNHNHEDTQDLMQKTFIDAYKNLLQFEANADFKTWIIRIMMKNCFRKLEKINLKNETMPDVKEYLMPMFPGRNHDTGKIIQNRGLGHIIENALRRIPFDYRMIFSLCDVNGLSISETAEVLGINELNVRIRLNRAKIMLRREIENGYSAGELFEFNLIYCDPMVENVMNKINKL